MTPNTYVIAPFLERAPGIKSSHIVQMPQTSSVLFVLAPKANLICFPIRGDTFLFLKKKREKEREKLYMAILYVSDLSKRIFYFKCKTTSDSFLSHCSSGAHFSLCVFICIHLCTLDG